MSPRKRKENTLINIIELIKDCSFVKCIPSYNESKEYNCINIRGEVEMRGEVQRY